MTSIVDWFDPNDPEHIRLWRHMEQTGRWPEGAVPDHVTISHGQWAMAIIAKQAACWMNHVEQLEREQAATPLQLTPEAEAMVERIAQDLPDTPRDLLGALVTVFGPSRAEVLMTGGDVSLTLVLSMAAEKLFMDRAPEDATSRILRQAITLANEGNLQGEWIFPPKEKPADQPDDSLINGPG